MGGRVDSATHDSAISKITNAAKYAAELREHLDQIIKGPAFKGTQRSQAFLRHVVERSLAGDFESLRERSIGIELFGRPAAYDTGEDAVVRVAASDVRRRLLQHYGSAGADSRFRIDIPSGSYLPEFRIIHEPEQPAAAPVAAAESSPQPAIVPPVAADEVPKLMLPRRTAIAIASGILLCGALAGLSLGHRVARPAVPRDDLISEMFSGMSGNMQVVVSDEGLVLAQVLLGRNCTLQEYEDFTCLNAPELQQDAVRRIGTQLAKRQVANIGDLQNAVHIHEQLRARNWEVSIRHARQVHARDFRDGNSIILGGTFGNPWAGLFQVPDTNFPLEEPRPAGRVPAYVNLHPKSGEPASFGVEKGVNGGKTITHARISLVDNMSHTGRVLLVAGQSVSATELAADFLFHRESGAKTRRMLDLAAGSPIPNLEMILRVTEVNQVGDTVELVACRRLLHRTD